MSGVPPKPMDLRARILSMLAMADKHRPFTRRALTKHQQEIQLAISRKPARAIPKSKEKRLINGVWTRDYDEAQ